MIILIKKQHQHGVGFLLIPHHRHHHLHHRGQDDHHYHHCHDQNNHHYHYHYQDGWIMKTCGVGLPPPASQTKTTSLPSWYGPFNGNI